MSDFWPRPGELVVAAHTLHFIHLYDSVSSDRCVTSTIERRSVALVLALARSTDFPFRDKFVLLLCDGRIGWAFAHKVRRVGPPEKAHVG